MEIAKTFRICLADCGAEVSLIEQPQRSISSSRARPAAPRIQQRWKKLAEKQ